MSSSSPIVKGPGWARSPLVTLPFLGVNIVWSTEMAFASPYLLSLGLSRAIMALVLLAAPLSGLVVQPIIGHIADKSTSRFGRRRPFMIGGCIATALGMLLLGFTREFASVYVPETSPANAIVTASLAVVALYIIDFTINAVMVVDRALIIDVLREDEQQDGSAWLARMTAIGSLIGLFVGQADLPHYLPALGKTQLQILSVIAGVVLLGTHIFTALTVKEAPLEKRVSDRMSKIKTSWHQSSITWFRTMLASFTNLPKGMMSICVIQLFSWLGWFPIVFFTTTWIGDIYHKQHPGSTITSTGGSEATRAGTLVLFYSALVSVVTSNVLPLFVLKTETTGTGGSSAVASWARGLTKKLPFRLDMATTWAIGLFLYGSLMWLTYFVTTVHGATWVFALSGISSTCIHWAPVSLLGELILSDEPVQIDKTRHATSDQSSSRAPLLAGIEEFGAENAAHEDDPSKVGGSSPDSDYQPHPVDEDIDDHDRLHTKDRAGGLLAILNTFTVLPQFVFIALSSVIFAIFEPGRGVFHQPSQAPEVPSHDDEGHHTDAIGLLFRIGGTSAFIACYLALRLARDLRRQQIIRALSQ